MFELQVSRTLEYAYNDYVVAQMALKLGYDSDYEILMRNSESYKMVIDTGTFFFCPFYSHFL